MASVYSTHTEVFTQRSFYTQKLLHTASFYRKDFLHREAFFYIITLGIAAPKPDLDAKAKKKTILKNFVSRNFKN